jgi:hypothetical protein
VSAPRAPARREVVTVHVPPVEVQLLDAKVTIVEVHRYETPWTGPMYHVACVVEWGGYRSQVFFVDAKDNEELERKLKVEISKMKLMVASGFTAPFQRIA